MKAAILSNDKAFRETLSTQLRESSIGVAEFPTAARALGMFEAKSFDAIIIHWKVYPCVNPGDPELQDIAATIPAVRMNQNLLYWQAALRVMDIVRADHSVNRLTPVFLLFPRLDEPQGNEGDRLARTSVELDLAGRQPVILITDISRDGIVNLITSHLSGTAGQ